MSRTSRDAAAEPARQTESVDDVSGEAGATQDLSLAQTEGLELAEQLGTGRGTRTWLAKEEQSREKFTVTFATGATSEERRPQQRAMARVAEHWAGVTHSHLVPVRGSIGGAGATGDMAGTAAEGANGVAALVCDHVNGISLARRIAQDGRVTPAELTPILMAVAKGLATLHDHGWVHGTLGPNSILLGQEQSVWLDGYGLPVSSDAETSADLNATTTGQTPAQAVVSWGHEDRPEMLDRSVARTPEDDVKALATLAWVALTGRAPGSDSHRVPLTLVCPAAPRGLVLMLEAALSDEPRTRPTAHEFAAGVAAIPTAKAAPKAARVQTPQIIRADGTEVKLGRKWRPTLHRGSSAVAASVSADRSWRRPLVLALAATALVGCAWFGVSELTGGEASPVAAEQDTARADEPVGEAATSAPGEEAASAPAIGPETNTQNSAEQAARALVASRAEALAAGDEQALAAVYVPGSRLAASDELTIAHAARQGGGVSDYTPLSGLSMKVDRIQLASSTGPESRRQDESRDAKASTFYAEILTRGWHGEIPEDSHVDREDTTVRQTVHLTVTETTDGWRIVDVTPVKRMD